jgi:hypothetical protein
MIAITIRADGRRKLPGISGHDPVHQGVARRDRALLLQQRTEYSLLGGGQLRP